ncbi:hypothetical protein F4V91_04655 [Neorhizobium galegae]|uniref:Uncharacterized protein n=1 Tax=Neorhizobium galegae TaxID=399 RepID=A0A6A1TP80_NEOGA|nr:hypothetical protein [Neorhizobium galegae]KAB1085785.1 hypothetical protein F4V91_04655 [Neorhizobium galegae]
MAQFSMEIMRLTGSVLRGNQHADRLPLPIALRYLFVAGAVLIGALGGRRREEVGSLLEGPLFKQFGQTYLTIYIEKTIQDVDAIPVPEIVEKAVEMLERLSAVARAATSTKWLFQFKSDFKDGQTLSVDTRFANHLADFATHCRLAPPDGDAAWKLNFHMLRKGFVTSAYHGNLTGNFDAINWFLRHRTGDMTRIYMDDGRTGAISYLRSEVARLTRQQLKNLSPEEEKYLADAKRALQDNANRTKLWDAGRQEFFVWSFMEVYDGAQQPIGAGAGRMLDMLTEMEQRAHARTRIEAVPTNGPSDVRQDVLRQVKVAAATHFLEPVPGVPMYCLFKKGRDDHTHLAECLKCRRAASLPWREAASGLIETKESGLGFLFGMRCATIPHAYRDHI